MENRAKRTSDNSAATDKSSSPNNTNLEIDLTKFWANLADRQSTSSPNQTRDQGDQDSHSDINSRKRSNSSNSSDTSSFSIPTSPLIRGLEDHTISEAYEKKKSLDIEYVHATVELFHHTYQQYQDLHCKLKENGEKLLTTYAMNEALNKNLTKLKGDRIREKLTKKGPNTHDSSDTFTEEIKKLESCIELTKTQEKEYNQILEKSEEKILGASTLIYQVTKELYKKIKNNASLVEEISPEIKSLLLSEELQKLIPEKLVDKLASPQQHKRYKQGEGNLPLTREEQPKSLSENSDETNSIELTGKTIAVPSINENPLDSSFQISSEEHENPKDTQYNRLNISEMSSDSNQNNIMEKETAPGADLSENYPSQTIHYPESVRTSSSSLDPSHHLKDTEGDKSLSAHIDLTREDDSAEASNILDEDDTSTSHQPLDPSHHLQETEKEKSPSVHIDLTRADDEAEASNNLSNNPHETISVEVQNDNSDENDRNSTDTPLFEQMSTIYSSIDSSINNIGNLLNTILDQEGSNNFDEFFSGTDSHIFDTTSNTSDITTYPTAPYNTNPSFEYTNFKRVNQSLRTMDNFFAGKEYYNPYMISSEHPNLPTLPNSMGWRPIKPFASTSRVDITGVSPSGKQGDTISGLSKFSAGLGLPKRPKREKETYSKKTPEQKQYHRFIMTYLVNNNEYKSLDKTQQEEAREQAREKWNKMSQVEKDKLVPPKEKTQIRTDNDA